MNLKAWLKYIPNRILMGIWPMIPYNYRKWLASHHPDEIVRRHYFTTIGVVIGKEAYINHGITLAEDRFAEWPVLRIGRRVSTSPNIVFITCASPNMSRLREDNYVKTKCMKSAPITVEDDAWIGTGAIIFPGVKIGREAIVGAGAVVREDVPPRTIVAGVPAKVIRKLDDERK